MKKYLISGALTLMTGMFIAGCTHDDVGYDSLYEEKTQTFEKVFTDLYGSIDPNHDWGFKSVATTAVANARSRAAGTRAENANANEWADVSNSTGYGGWLVPDALSDGQKERVKAYFQANPDPGYKDPQWRNFFVQQVYKGGAGGGNTTEKVTAANGSVYTSTNMNLLTVGKNAVHINNFNHGDATEVDVLDNGANISTHTGETYHKDKIMLMVNIDDTSCFGYHETGSSNESDPSGQHNDRCALVSAAVIDAWAEANGGIGEAVTDEWNRSFLGFDLAIKEGDQIWTNKVQAFTSGMNMGYDGLYYSDDNTVAFEDGENWTKKMPNGMEDVMKDKEGNPLKILISNTNFYSGDLQTLSDNDLRKDMGGGKVYVNMAPVMNLIDQGYYPVDGSAFKTWVKPTESFDHYYSDWIVTLTQGVRTSDKIDDIPDNPDTPHQGDDVTKTSTGTKHRLMALGRVFVEDLYRANREDLDYNDAVFDAAIWEVTTNGTITVDDDGKDTFEATDQSEVTYEAEIYLIAAGGTIPLKINGDEVHALFAAENPSQGISGVTMINTRGQYSSAFGSYVNGIAPVYKKYDMTDLLKGKATISLNDIPVDVIWSVDGMQVAASLNNKALVEYEKDEDGNYVTTGEGDNKQPVVKSTSPATAPHMIQVPLGTRWATERRNIEDCYPSFSLYVGTPSTDVWNSATTSSSVYLYEGNVTTTFDKSKYGDGTKELVSGTFYYYTDVQEVTTGGTPLWTGPNKGQFDVSISANDLAGTTENSVIRINITSSSSTGYWHIVLQKKDWSGGLTIPDWNNSNTISYNPQPDNFPGYVEFKLSNTVKNTIIEKGGFVVQTANNGDPFSIDNIVLIK